MQLEWGNTFNTTYTSGASWVQTYGIPVPLGNVMANGNRSILVTEVAGFVAGNGGPRTVRLYYGQAYTGYFDVGDASSAQPTGLVGTNHWLVTGGAEGFGIDLSGPAYFAGSTAAVGGGSSVDSNGVGYAGQIYGAITYLGAPSACTLNSATATTTSGAVQLNFSGPGDNGGAAVSGYTWQRATDSAFTQNVASGITTIGTPTITGLTPGTLYYFRVGARNAVTDAANSGGAWTAPKAATAPGTPTAPATLTASASPSAFGAVALAWSPPVSAAGGVTGYTIFRDGVAISTTSAAVKTRTITGLTPYTSYTFSVAARNAYADSHGTTGPQSVIRTVVAQGAPTAPQNAVATPSATVVGRVTVSWTPPVTTGTGGVTRYSLYFSTGVLITNSIPAGSSSYVVDGLVPSTPYGFYVRAWNALADVVGTPGASSSTASAVATGAPLAPTSVSAAASSAVAGRLILSWVPVGFVTGFNVYEIVAGSKVLIGTPVGAQFIVDNLASGTHTYQVHAKNVVTEMTTPPSEGTGSVQFSGTPGASTSQPVANIPVSNASNVVFNGTYPILALTADTLSYFRVSADVAPTPVDSVPAVNETNLGLLGVYQITSVPTPATMTFTKNTANIPLGTGVTGGKLQNNTNLLFNGTREVTAVDDTNKTVSFARASSDISSRSTLGTISNLSNAVYNGVGYPIIAVGVDTIQYARTSADIAETPATGTVTDTTNATIFNGTYAVLAAPIYNSFTYTKVNPNIAATSIPISFGTGYRAVSLAVLEVRYRSGWLG